MFKKTFLCCILPIIIGEPFIGLHEANEIFQVFFHDEVTAVSKFYWLLFSDYSLARSSFDVKIAYAKHYFYRYYQNYHYKHLVQ